jgi:allantoicase
MTDPGSAVDLAARWLGAGVVAASDESFGFKENLLVEAPPRFEPGRYDHRGEVVDGWETRRRRSGSHDWVIIRLGAAGRVHEIDVDTSNFTGNFPATCRIEALVGEGYPSVDELTSRTDWEEISPSAPLRGDTHNLFRIQSTHRFTHLRLTIAPDGGVARVRAYGTVIPDPRWWDTSTVELSSVREGGRVISSSDDFYGCAERLIRPDRAATMGEGWETARRRSGSHDHVVLALAVPGRLQGAEIDTTHFKYNASAAFELWGSPSVPGPAGTEPDWQPLLARTPLQPDTRHRFALDSGAVAAVRLDAFPDGGLARVRLFGVPTPAGRAAAQRSWFEQ